jgi:hypothetical protein
MNADETEKTPAEIDEEQRDRNGPLSRWNSRKQAVLAEQQANMEKVSEQETATVLTDEDMPPVDSLTPDSDYTGFLSPGVSEDLRRLALRKLFHGPEFNVIDGLDDYDGDYTNFAKLGDVITSEMRHRMEIEARRKLEQAKDSLSELPVDDGLDNTMDAAAAEKTGVLVTNADEVQKDAEGEGGEDDIEEIEEDEDLSSESVS